jgi:S-adenosylmethionine:diacylglycerol 3-amino-3-carboxypropyl transferase
MNTLTFDTLKFARRLQAAGMESRLAEEQAEAMADVLKTNLDELATKRDLQDLRQEFRHEMAMMEQRLIIKLGAMLTLSIGIVAALVKLL